MAKEEGFINCLCFCFRTIIGPNYPEFRGDGGIRDFVMLHNLFKQ